MKKLILLIITMVLVTGCSKSDEKEKTLFVYIEATIAEVHDEYVSVVDVNHDQIKNAKIILKEDFKSKLKFEENQRVKFKIDPEVLDNIIPEMMAQSAELLEEQVGFYQKATHDEVKKMVDSQEENFVIIDVRTTREYKSGHIEGAISLPEKDIKTGIEDIVKDKDTQIFVYGKDENRSEISSKQLIDMDYIYVGDMGEISDWEYGFSYE